jgi:hypothetical protein
MKLTAYFDDQPPVELPSSIPEFFNALVEFTKVAEVRDENGRALGRYIPEVTPDEPIIRTDIPHSV